MIITIYNSWIYDVDKGIAYNDHGQLLIYDSKLGQGLIFPAPAAEIYQDIQARKCARAKEGENSGRLALGSAR